MEGRDQGGRNYAGFLEKSQRGSSKGDRGPSSAQWNDARHTWVLALFPKMTFMITVPSLSERHLLLLVYKGRRLN